jgi:lysophospholipase L1-like esterase
LRLRSLALAALCASAALSTTAASANPPPRYYVSLGDSLAASYQPNGDLEHGYTEQLYSALHAPRPSLRLVKLGCTGESTASMLFGTQDPRHEARAQLPTAAGTAAHPPG